MKKASIAPASPARRASSAPRVTQVLAANAGEAEMARVHALNFVSTNFTVDKRGQKSVSKLKTVRIARNRQNRLLISPGSSADVSTNFAVLLAFIANAFFVPLQLAFLGRGAPAAGWHAGLFTLYALVDAFFWLDIVKSFFTSVELGATTPPLLRPTKIARWYVLRWLALDVAAALPIDWATSDFAWRLLKLCKLPRLAHLVWHASERRSIHSALDPLDTTWRKAAEDALLARAPLLAVALLLVVHVGACGWHAVSGGAVDAAGALLPAAYAHAFWWALSVWSSAGAPHAPATDGEVAYASVYAVVALLAFLQLVAHVLTTTLYYQQEHLAYRKNMRVIGQWVRHRRLPPALRLRVANYCTPRHSPATSRCPARPRLSACIGTLSTKAARPATASSRSRARARRPPSPAASRPPPTSTRTPPTVFRAQGITTCPSDRWPRPPVARNTLSARGGGTTSRPPSTLSLPMPMCPGPAPTTSATTDARVHACEIRAIRHTFTLLYRDL